MKKESLIVGIFGLSFGLLVAWAIWNFKSAGPKPQELTITPSPIAAVSPTPAQPSSAFTLDSPKNEVLATESSILVAGTAKSSSTIVISANLDDQIVTAGGDGKFSQPVDLEEGENTITVTAYDASQKEDTLERTVIYTKESL
ncbi:MAG: hypothetical protein Q8P89_01290 [bacterium]|nr:hypothetical protein [bacterium]